MKYIISVAGQRYEVEIEDLNVRPIVARVDGEAFEVNPENGTRALGGAPPSIRVRVTRSPRPVRPA